MKVIVDGTMYHDAPRGGGFNYLNELIPRLANFPEVQLRVVMARTATIPSTLQGLPAVTKEVFPRAPWFPQGRAKRFLGASRRWAEKQLWYARFFPVSRAIYHSASYMVPPVAGIQAVFTMYDMIAELFPEEMNQLFHDEVRARKAECVRRGTHFLAISQQTKDDLCQLYQVPPDRVSVVHLGVNHEVFSQAATPAETEALKLKFGIKGPYILYVGGRLHHKNFGRFVEAYATSSLTKDYYVLVVGADWEETEKALLRKLGIQDRIWLVHLPTQEQLAQLYRLADFFVYPSVYEGFGLPLLEAMASGTPVASSGTSSMGEIAGDAAELFNPENIADMRRAMEALTDPTRAAALRQAGHKRVQQFSWDRTAQLTVQAYRRALKT